MIRAFRAEDGGLREVDLAAPATPREVAAPLPAAASTSPAAAATSSVPPSATSSATPPAPAPAAPAAATAFPVSPGAAAPPDAAAEVRLAAAIAETPPADAADALPDALWYDLLSPTRAEERALESRLSLELPTREDMHEIEISSRLYSEDGAHFLTALIPAHTDQDDAVLSPVTFVLARDALVTIRYAEPRVFSIYQQRALKMPMKKPDPVAILLGLLETVVDRIADILERVGAEVDAISRAIFGPPGGSAPQKGPALKTTIEAIGRKGDFNSNLRVSLVTLDRLTSFLGPRLLGAPKAQREILKLLASDIRSLEDHSDFIGQKITFLLDATLGLINIEQNGIIKIFSVASVIFLPPTLIASIYGMNFDHMPELHFRFGYLMALGMMVVSAVLPYAYFKRRGWL